MLLKGIPEGSDITLLNCIYRYPQKQEDGKYTKDIMQVLYRDNVTGEKHVTEVESPTYVYYMTKDDVYIDSNELFLDKSKLDRIEVPYTDLLKDIAERTNNLDFFYDNIKNRNRKANNALHDLKNVFNSDMNISDHFRYRFSQEYKNSTFQLSKGYFDIEVDTINMVGDFPQLGECPVNAISFIDSRRKQVYAFLLRNPNNPLIEKFEKEEVATGKAFDDLKEFVINHVGGEKVAKLRHKILDFQYHMFFYDNEIDLIKDFFNAVNISKLDFMMAWNMAFDIPYLIERIKVLGYDPALIICPKDIHTKIATYYIDNDPKNKGIPSKRNDSYIITGYSIWIDQMIQYASIRKGQASQSNRLDDVGERIAHVGKLDYSKITTSITKLPYLDYKTFVFYNIMDTLVQHCIENQINDIEYLFNKCLNNNTRYEKAHRQSVYLTNRATLEFANDELYGELIIGNNHNRGSEKPKEKYPGAMVGDPLKNSDEPKFEIFGKKVNIVNNAVDFDYTSLYPSITRENNMAPNTQIGRILIDEPVHDKDNRFKYAKYARGGAFLEDMMSWNFVDFCSRWLHYGTYREVIEDIEEFLKTNPSDGYMVKNGIRPLIHINNGPVPLITEGVRKHPLIEVIPTKEELEFDSLINSIANKAQMDLNSIEEIMRRRESEKFEDELLEEMLGEEKSNESDSDE